MVLDELGACLGGKTGEPPHPTCRLERAVGRVQKAGRERIRKRPVWRVYPLDGDPVGDHCVVLGTELIALFVVDRKPKTPDLPEGVAGQRLELFDLRLGPAPDRAR